MIWALGLALCLVVSLYLAAPFLAQDVVPSETSEIETYKAELRAIEQSEEPEQAKRKIIQARLLKAAKSDLPMVKAQSVIFPMIIGVSLVSASLGIYTLLGTPNFSPETRQPPPPATDTASQDFRSLLPKFEARLAENPNDAMGWHLYGRTLMLSGDSEAGIRAYEKALELTDTPEFRKEYEAAKTFARQTQSGPSAEDITAMQNLSAADRENAIRGMVESLRARLETEPDDVEGWVRLLRSRKVLNQTEQAKADITVLRQVLPDQAENIIAQTGWSD